MNHPRRPALPVSIEDDPDHRIITSDGQVFRDLIRTYSAEDNERIRLGYCCLHCGESQVDHGAPFPEKCWVCGFPMREQQAQRYEKEFVGGKQVGPQTSIQDQMAAAREFVERESFKPKPSIIVPGRQH